MGNKNGGKRFGRGTNRVFSAALVTLLVLSIFTGLITTVSQNAEAASGETVLFSDDFEGSTKTTWYDTGDGDQAVQVTSEVAWSGSYSLKKPYDAGGPWAWQYTLIALPHDGVKIRFAYRTSTNAYENRVYLLSEDLSTTYFMVAPSLYRDSYRSLWFYRNGEWTKVTFGSEIPAYTWEIYEVEISGNQIKATVYDSSGNYITDTGWQTFDGLPSGTNTYAFALRCKPESEVWIDKLEVYSTGGGSGIANPGFETTGGWTTETIGGSYAPTVNLQSTDGSYEGSYCAKMTNTLGSRGTPRASYIRQTIILSPTATTLSYYVKYWKDYWGPSMGVRIKDASGNVLADNREGTGGRRSSSDWVMRTIDVSSYAGQTITIEIYLEDLSTTWAGNSDHGGWIAVDLFVITAPPTASFSYTAHHDPPLVGESIIFDASGSTDTDGTIVKYEWDFDNDGTYDAEGVTCTHVYDSYGTKTVRLRVTDDMGATATTTMTVEVNAPPQITDMSVTDGSGNDVSHDNGYWQWWSDGGVTFKFRPTVSDPDGSIASYEWDFGDGARSSGTGTPGTVSHTYTDSGTYRVTLTVTDDDGAKATYAVPVGVAVEKPVECITEGWKTSTWADHGFEGDGSVYILLGDFWYGGSYHEGEGMISVHARETTCMSGGGKIYQKIQIPKGATSIRFNASLGGSGEWSIDEAKVSFSCDTGSTSVSISPGSGTYSLDVSSYWGKTGTLEIKLDTWVDRRGKVDLFVDDFTIVYGTGYSPPASPVIRDADFTITDWNRMVYIDMDGDGDIDRFHLEQDGDGVWWLRYYKNMGTPDDYAPWMRTMYFDTELDMGSGDVWGLFDVEGDHKGDLVLNRDNLEQIRVYLSSDWQIESGHGQWMAADYIWVTVPYQDKYKQLWEKVPSGRHDCKFIAGDFDGDGDIDVVIELWFDSIKDYYNPPYYCYVDHMYAEYEISSDGTITRTYYCTYDDDGYPVRSGGTRKFSSPPWDTKPYPTEPEKWFSVPLVGPVRDLASWIEYVNESYLDEYWDAVGNASASSAPGAEIYDSVGSPGTDGTVPGNPYAEKIKAPIVKKDTGEEFFAVTNLNLGPLSLSGKGSGQLNLTDVDFKLTGNVVQWHDYKPIAGYVISWGLMKHAIDYVEADINIHISGYVNITAAGTASAESGDLLVSLGEVAVPTPIVGLPITIGPDLKVGMDMGSFSAEGQVDFNLTFNAHVKWGAEVIRHDPPPDQYDPGKPWQKQVWYEHVPIREFSISQKSVSITPSGDIEGSFGFYVYPQLSVKFLDTIGFSGGLKIYPLKLTVSDGDNKVSMEVQGIFDLGKLDVPVIDLTAAVLGRVQFPIWSYVYEEERTMTFEGTVGYEGYDVGQITEFEIPAGVKKIKVELIDHGTRGDDSRIRLCLERYPPGEHVDKEYGYLGTDNGGSEVKEWHVEDGREYIVIKPSTWDLSDYCWKVFAKRNEYDANSDESYTVVITFYYWA